MKRIIILLILVTVSGCAELSKRKVDSDGYYRFKNLPITEKISVWAPNECLLDMFVFEPSNNTVDFTTGRGYWMASGTYAVQVSALRDELKDDAEFLNRSREYLKGYVENDRKSLGVNIEFIEGKEIKVNENLGYQAIGFEENKAVFVVTGVRHSKTITMASLIYPLGKKHQKVKGSGSPQEQLPWKCYNKFVNSVVETK